MAKPKKSPARESSANMQRKSGAGAARVAKPSSTGSASKPRTKVTAAPPPRAKAAAATKTRANDATTPRSDAAAPKPLASGRRYWLLKTEPSSFSFDDLWSAPRRRTAWTGVRNHQARNFIRDSMQVGDLVILYHSSAEPTGVAGFARIVTAARADPTQFDPADDHFDSAAKPASPTWFEIEVEALMRATLFVTLSALKSDPRLERMLVVQRGQRLSVQPVHVGEWRAVVEMAGLRADDFS